jgi:prepilin peptidase CpaA
MSLHLIVPSLILIAGIINDLKSKKVKNYIILVSLILSIINVYYFSGFTGLKFGGLSLLVTFASCLPLVLAKIMGGGDMKLLMVVSTAINPMSAFFVLIYSFFWGALLGIIKAVLNKQGLQLLFNTLDIAKGGGKAVPQENLHKIPYTVALFLGWLTQLSLTGFRG